MGVTLIITAVLPMIVTMIAAFIPWLSPWRATFPGSAEPSLAAFRSSARSAALGMTGEATWLANDVRCNQLIVTTLLGVNDLLQVVDVSKKQVQ